MKLSVYEYIGKLKKVKQYNIKIKDIKLVKQYNIKIKDIKLKRNRKYWIRVKLKEILSGRKSNFSNLL